MNINQLSANEPKAAKPYQYQPFPKAVRHPNGDEIVVETQARLDELLSQGWTTEHIKRPTAAGPVNNSAVNLSTLPGAISAYETVRRELEEKVAVFNRSWEDLQRENQNAKAALSGTQDQLKGVADEHELLFSAYTNLKGELEAVKAAYAELKRAHEVLKAAPAAPAENIFTKMPAAEPTAQSDKAAKASK